MLNRITKIFTLIISFQCYLIANTKAQSFIVGFYNFENFYDTTDQINVNDEAFLPKSVKGYNSQLFQQKSTHLANVLYGMGNIENANGIALLGIAEIENKQVLIKLAEEPLLKKYHYRFIHFDSKDSRGIDVALMYHPSYFKPYQYKSISLSDATHFTDYSTRDILYVHGLLNNTWVHIFVNHWPSRRGGERVSELKRIWASSVCKKMMDSIENRDPTAKIIVMGDFNDNPTNKSMLQLNMFNPFLSLYKKGMGSMAFRDSWSLFDQILLNDAWRWIPRKETWKSKESIAQPILIKEETKKCPPIEYFDLTYYKSIVYKNYNLTEQEGKYQGYPKRTWDGDAFRGGYSDHFPVLIIFHSKMPKTL